MLCHVMPIFRWAMFWLVHQLCWPGSLQMDTMRRWNSARWNMIASSWEDMDMQVRTPLEIDEIMDVMVIVPAYTWRSSHDQQHVWHCLTMNLRVRCWAHWGSTAGWIMSGKSSSQLIIEGLTRIMHWYTVTTCSLVYEKIHLTCYICQTSFLDILRIRYWVLFPPRSQGFWQCHRRNGSNSVLGNAACSPCRRSSVVEFGGADGESPWNCWTVLGWFRHHETFQGNDLGNDLGWWKSLEIVDLVTLFGWYCHIPRSDLDMIIVPLILDEEVPQ